MICFEDKTPSKVGHQIAEKINRPLIETKLCTLCSRFSSIAFVSSDEKRAQY